MQTKSLKNILSLIRVNSRNSRTFFKLFFRVNSRHSRTIFQKTIRANSCNSRTFFFLFLFAVSCSKSPTDSRTGTLTGTVLLEGQTNHSGITVAFTPLDNWREIRVIQKIQYSNDVKGKDRYILSNGASKLAELDTTILRYNREYPLVRRVFGGNVGFFTRRLFGGPISQATEFVYTPCFMRACPPGVWRNHLLREVAAEAKTNKYGLLKIDREKERIVDLVIT